MIAAAILLSVQLVIQVLTVVFVLRLNMLPSKYVVLLILLMTLALEGVALLMLIPVKQQIRLWRRIFACVLSALIMAGCVAASWFAARTYNFVDGISNKDGSVVTHNAFVVVLNESPAQCLADTKSFRYGMVPDSDSEVTQQMVKVVKEKTGNTVTFTEYQQVTAMVDALYNKQIDALIMREDSLALLLEQPGYRDFMPTRARKLHTETVQQIIDVPVQPPREDLEKSSFVVYISGSDTRSSLLVKGLSDVNILAVVNPNTKQILLINTPRDYYIPHPESSKGAKDKLTHCGSSGVGCSIKALEMLYNTKIDYYAQINFTGFEKLVDAVGGITVNSDRSFYTIAGTYIKKGENQFDGKKALQFARERQNLSDGDNDRGKNQMKVIKAIVEKLTSSTTLISNYADILKSLEKMFATNFHMEEIGDLVKMQLDDMAKWDIQSFAVDGTGGLEWCYSWSDFQLYVTWPNEAAVNQAKSLIDRVFAGQVITAEDTVLPKK